MPDSPRTAKSPRFRLADRPGLLLLFVLLAPIPYVASFYIAAWVLERYPHEGLRALFRILYFPILRLFEKLILG